jgi:hypothetical protein
MQAKPCLFIAGLSFHTEGDGEMFSRNVGRLSTDYTALYLRREDSS